MLKFTDELISLVLHSAQTWLNMQIWEISLFFPFVLYHENLTENLILIWFRRTVDIRFAWRQSTYGPMLDRRSLPTTRHQWKNSTKSLFYDKQINRTRTKSVGRGDSIKRNCVITASSKTNTGRQECRRNRERMRRRRERKKTRHESLTDKCNVKLRVLSVVFIWINKSHSANSSARGSMAQSEQR